MKRVELRSSPFGVPTALRFRGSVMPFVVVPMAILGLWACGVYFVNQQTSVVISQPTFITVTSFVLSLLLAFRTNTAYERYSEGRRIIAQLTTCIRNLLRVIATGSTAALETKRLASDLFVAYFVALKNHMRGTSDHPAIVKTHLEKLEQAGKIHVPVFVLHLISNVFNECFKSGKIDASHLSNALATLNSMTEVLGSAERILNTPIPKAYSIHLNQCVYAYLFLLPLQLHPKLGALAIPVTMFATFIYVGVECIGREIENPFGEDYNDLPLEEYIAEIKAEVDELAESQFYLHDQ